VSQVRPYDSTRWRSVRLAVLSRDRYACRIGLPGCRRRAGAVDHIIDWRDGGSWFDLSNLRAACISCNTALRNRRVAERARRLRENEASPPPKRSRQW
jgi:5-methylcytosine-specific restriction endonuclease McrA